MIIVNTITEYDIANAGVAILFVKGKINETLYKELISLDKKKRQVKTGLLLKDNPTFSKIQSDGFKEYIDKFISDNKLEEFNVLEIARDAVWVVGRAPKYTKFGTILFREKRKYTILFKYKKIFFYANSKTEEFEIRGLNTDNTVFCDIIKDILLSYEYEMELYDKLHEIKSNLEENELYYGENLGVNISNLNIIKKMIKEML